MDVFTAIQEIAKEINGEVKEKKGIFTLEAVLAERKAFLSKKKATYVAKFRVDEAAKEIRFTEMLTESGSGLSGGDAGVSFGVETYKSGGGPREGHVLERISGLGPKYEMRFDYGQIRKRLEAKAVEMGYRLTYVLTPKGL